MELGRKFNITGHINRGHLTKITGLVDGRRLDTLYRIESGLDVTCGNGCSERATYLLYMRTHKGNVSLNANCERHSHWFMHWFDAPRSLEGWE